MYKKKDRKALYITIAAISAVILLLVVLGIINRQRRNRQPEETTDITATHEILIYKAVGGNIEFDETYLVEENDEEVHLKAKEDEMVTMLVTPLSGRTFTDLKINDASNITREENYLVNDAAGSSKRINFVMPHTDIIMNSPRLLLEAGVGDIISNYTALYDWELDCRLNHGQPNDFAYMLSERALNALLYSNIKSFTSQEGVKMLAQSLVLGGIAMQIAGSSRPCSGFLSSSESSTDRRRSSFADNSPSI